MADRESEEFERALHQLGPRDQNLAAAVKTRLAAGQSRADAFTALTRFREDLARAGRYEDEDVVLEVMDYLIGWASPHQKLWRRMRYLMHEFHAWIELSESARKATRPAGRQGRRALRARGRLRLA